MMLKFVRWYEDDTITHDPLHMNDVTPGDVNLM
jgi:hypothetical protein